MSERNHTPRSGGRAAEPKRGTTGRRDKGLGRDADAQETTDRAAARRSAARGVRHFADEDDTRRSGIADRPVRGDARNAVAGRTRATDAARAGTREPGGVRGRARTTDDVRGGTREGSAVRGAARDAEGVRGAARESGGVRGAARETGAVRGAARGAEGVRGAGLGKAREAVAGRARAGERDRKAAAPPRRGGKAEPAGRGVPGAAGRDRAAVRPGRTAAAGRRPVTDAPVDGTAALDIEVTAGEPLRVAEPAAAPRLRVAPPVPIGAPRAPFVAAVLGLVVVGVLGILVINTKTNENSFRIADLQKQNTALENRHQDLENQLVAASSIGNLDAAARRLGMVKAEKLALIRLPDGKRIGVPAPVSGDPAVTAQEAKARSTDKGAGNIVPDAGADQPGADGTAPGTGGTGNGRNADQAGTNGGQPAAGGGR